MAHTSRDHYFDKNEGRVDYCGHVSPEYQFEKPAIDRLLDYISNQESQKAAIDILIQEYLERIGSPLTTYRSSHISSFINTPIETDNETNTNLSNTQQQIQTPNRGVPYYQMSSSIYITPLTTSNDIMYDTNHDYRNTASTPLLPPSSTRSYRSPSITNDKILNTPSTRNSVSSTQDLPLIERYPINQNNSSQDNRLKRAAAEERRQATRHFGKVQPGLIWTSPLPVRARIFSIRPPSLSCKIFLGGIPHDLNPRDLQERLESFGPVRLEWPNKDNVQMHRNSSNHTGFVYAVYENEESVHKILHICSTKTDRTLDDGRCEYYLDVHNQRTNLRRKSIQIIPWFVEDSQWSTDNDCTSNGYANWEQRLNSTECISRTVFIGALHGMMTAYALARICHELFGDVEYAAIDTDRNKYPIGSGRVVFVNAHSYYAAVTANYLMIECDKFCKVIQIDPYLSDNVTCSGFNGQWCANSGQYFCRSLKCMKYYCAACWDLNPSHMTTETHECQPPAMIHKPLMRNARTA